MISELSRVHYCSHCVDHMVYDKLLKVLTSHVILKGVWSNSGQLIELMVM